MTHASSLLLRACVVIATTLATLGAEAWARPLQAQFTIDNLELHFRPDGSGAMTTVIPIRSSVDSVQQVQITLQDWDRDSIGGNKFAEYGSHPKSCTGKLEVFPRTLQLGPRATEFVRVTYTGRELPDPGCWGAVMLERVRPPEPQRQGASVSINLITGVKVYVHATGARAEAEVISADVETFWRKNPDAPSDSTFVRQAAVRVANVGSAHLRIRTTMEIRDQATQLVATTRGPEAYVTPSAFRDVLIPIAGLQPGRYVAVVLLDYGATEILAAQVEFEIP